MARNSLGETSKEETGDRCVSCGHGELVEGRLQGTGRLYFRPRKTRFFVLAEALVETSAWMCPDCGHVQLFADADKLAKLRGQSQEK